MDFDTLIDLVLNKTSDRISQVNLPGRAAQVVDPYVGDLVAVMAIFLFLSVVQILMQFSILSELRAACAGAGRARRIPNSAIVHE